MVEKVIGRLVAPNLQAGRSRFTPNTVGNNVYIEAITAAIQCLRLSVKGSGQVDIAAANDFGSVELVALPNTNLLIVGVKVNISTGQVGFTSNAGDQVDLALGTVATASTTFANAGEKDVCGKIDGANVSSGIGLVKGGFASNLFIPAGATNKIFMNASDPVTSGTGNLFWTSGVIDIFFMDLGV